MSRFQVVLLLLLSTIVASGGCNVDGLFADRQHRDAPMTSFDRPEGVEVPDIVIVDGSEVDMVEQVLANRAVYKRSLDALREFYSRRGYHNKMQWAETELADLARVKPFRYILSAEVPAESLKPTRSIAEADRMYDKGLNLMRRGGHNLPVVFRKDYMHEALQVFTEMITRYPESDKIDDAAFECGEILKEYYENQDRLALLWYDRARQWDPRTPHPVLFQSAVVYDFRLHDRAKALELYQRVLREETFNKSNLAFASRRVHELTYTDDATGDSYQDNRMSRNVTRPRSNAEPRAGVRRNSIEPRRHMTQPLPASEWQSEQRGDGIARSDDNAPTRSSYDR